VTHDRGSAGTSGRPCGRDPVMVPPLPGRSAWSGPAPQSPWEYDGDQASSQLLPPALRLPARPRGLARAIGGSPSHRPPPAPPPGPPPVPGQSAQPRWSAIRPPRQRRRHRPVMQGGWTRSREMPSVVTSRGGAKGYPPGVPMSPLSASPSKPAGRSAGWLAADPPPERRGDGE
jgi:hypothetical protein